MGDLASFSVNQEAALSVCEARKDAAIEIVDAFNTVNAQVQESVQHPPRRHWWNPFD